MLPEPGQYLKSVREKSGYSLRDAEKLSGYSRGYLQDIESGRRLPQLFAIRCIADAISSGQERDQIMSLFVEAQTGKAC
ncbi:MAG: helix-turn-helix domain-containing protein [Pseudobdellovibrionaceae bacterium]|nr:helix-turn-helix domain-containing protein [Pseudobdellovibrionaceae bacterium]